MRVGLIRFLLIFNAKRDVGLWKTHLELINFQPVTAALYPASSAVYSTLCVLPSAPL
jgi:hypothetical protein